MIRAIFIIYLLSIFLNGEERLKMTNISLKIGVDKKLIKVGDKIKFYYEIENNDTKNINVLIKNFESNLYWDFKGLDNNKELSFRSKNFVGWDLNPKNSDIYFINNSSKKTFVMEAYLKSGFLNLVSENWYWGKYLYFPNTEQYIILRGNNKISILGLYEFFNSSKRNETEKVNNLLINNLLSKEIVLEIR